MTLKSYAKFCRKCGTKVSRTVQTQQVQGFSRSVSHKNQTAIQVSQSSSPPHGAPRTTTTTFQQPEVSSSLSENRSKQRFDSLFQKEIVDLNRIILQFQNTKKYRRENLVVLNREITDVKEKFEKVKKEYSSHALTPQATEVLRKAEICKYQMLDFILGSIDNSSFPKRKKKSKNFSKNIKRLEAKLDTLKSIHDLITEISDDISVFKNQLSEIKNQELTLKNAINRNYKIRAVAQEIKHDLERLVKTISENQGQLEISESSSFLVHSQTILSVLDYEKPPGSQLPISKLLADVTNIVNAKANFKDQITLQSDNNTKELMVEQRFKTEFLRKFTTEMEVFLQHHTDKELKDLKQQSKQHFQNSVQHSSEKKVHLSIGNQLRKEERQITRSASQERRKRAQMKHSQQLSQEVIKMGSKMQDWDTQKMGTIEVDISSVLSEVLYHVKIKEKTTESIKFDYYVGSIRNFELHKKGEIYELVCIKDNFWGKLKKLKFESETDFDYSLTDIFLHIKIVVSPSEIEARVRSRKSLPEKFLKLSGYKNLYLKAMPNKKLRIKLDFEKLDKDNLKQAFNLIRDLDLISNSL